MSRRTPDDLVRRMYADYSTPLSLAATARKYGRDPQTLRDFFRQRGLSLRVDPRGCARKLPSGQIAPLRPLTWQEIDELIAAATKLVVPPVLKREWRRWSLGKRAVFILRVRAKLRSPHDRPTSPFSGNVVPFDYGTAEAWEIVKRMNAGRTSRVAAVKIDISSQGVIFRDRLWFWNDKVGYQSGPWTPEGGRPSLHKTLWEEANGRVVPAHHIIIFLDGNKNNLLPENLALKHRGDHACDNKEAGRAKARRTRRFFQMTAAAAAISHV